MINSGLGQGSQRSMFCNPEAFNNGLRMDLLVDELFCFTEEFSC